MGTAYEYYSKLRVMDRVFAQTGAPRSILVMGLPEKHGYDLDLVLLAHHLRQRAGVVHRASPAGGADLDSTVPLVVCEDRPEVLDGFRYALQCLPDPDMARHVESIQVDGLTDVRTLAGRRFDWMVSTASVQRLPDQEIVVYLQNARQVADRIFLFIPNSGNRAHLTLSGLRGLELDQVLALCRHAAAARSGPRAGSGPQRSHLLLSAGHCDIPPFPPGLQRSTGAKERAIHSPLEIVAMWCLQMWCLGEAWMPRILKDKLAHLVYVALDLREEAP